jgi:hypothetical protein
MNRGSAILVLTDNNTLVAKDVLIYQSMPN